MELNEARGYDIIVNGTAVSGRTRKRNETEISAVLADPVRIKSNDFVIKPGDDDEF